MPPSNVDNFLISLSAVAPPAGGGAYSFMEEDGSCRGWAQFIIRSGDAVELHRLWTLVPGRGNGKFMLSTICGLADRHGVEISLRPLPFGRKPYPRTRDELAAWYQRYGFTGTRRKIIRSPKRA